MKVVVAHGFGLGKEARDLMEEVADVVVLEDGSPQRLLAEIADADSFVLDIEPPVTAELIAAAPRLRHIGRKGVGVDIVDVKAATRRGIYVTNVPDVTSDSVAEFAVTLLLSLAKNICRCDRAVREGRWNEERRILIDTNVELVGKTHGIVGLGRIGSRVATRCQAFGMRVIYHKRNRDLAFEEATGVRYVPLETLLRESDSVSLHLPLTDETRNLIDAPQLGLMKKTAFLINHSRGAVVNERALCDALREGRLAGYGTDVYEQEPPDPAGELFSFPNVVAAPHLGGATKEARARAGMAVAQEVVRISRGEVPKNLVNREVLSRLRP